MSPHSLPPASPLPITSAAAGAALAVLSEASVDRMHYADIAEVAVRTTAWRPGGNTARHTLNAAVRAYVLRAQAMGSLSYFRREGDGYISLSPAATVGIDAHLSRHRRAAREAALEMVRRLHPREVELLIAELLRRMGFDEVEPTRYSRDGGIDVRGIYVSPLCRVRVAVQVKREARAIGRRDVCLLRGVLADGERGVFFTTSTFQRAARLFAAQFAVRPVTLVDGAAVAELLIRHQLGVRTRLVEVAEVVGLDAAY